MSLFLAVCVLFQSLVEGRTADRSNEPSALTVTVRCAWVTFGRPMLIFPHPAVDYCPILPSTQPMQTWAIHGRHTIVKVLAISGILWTYESRLVFFPQSQRLSFYSGHLSFVLLDVNRSQCRLSAPPCSGRGQESTRPFLDLRDVETLEDSIRKCIGGRHSVSRVAL